jgi:signal transduction histidine kinase
MSPIAVGPGGQALEHRLAEKWVEAIASPVGTTGESVVSFRDITRQKALEEAKNVFLATTSHELKTPLTVIKGYAATLLVHWKELNETDREASLRAISHRAEQLSRLVEEILLGTRAEAQRADVECRPTDVFGFVNLWASGIPESADHRIHLDLPPERPWVAADGSALEKVLDQLLDNAVKYSPGGGPITVGGRVSDLEVCVFVSDQGIGFDASESSSVFSRFYQSDQGDDRRYGGVGLGLYIVKRLVEAQGGRVSARGAPGVGATFEVTLRRVPAPAGA